MKLLFLLMFIPSLSFAANPKLVLVIVIDQFRADNLTRFQKDFLPIEKNGRLGGFRYLIANGAYYPFAQYDILQPMTGPGHATILSGSYPYLNGITTNTWYNREKKKVEYCVGDDASKTIQASYGLSPRKFLGTTVGDELKNAGYDSNIVSIALKDRAAILLGGHRADLALWMDQKSLHWTTSSFYRPDSTLPAFANELNAQMDKQKGQIYVWNKSEGINPNNPKSGASGQFADAIGTSFPHRIERGTIAELGSPAGLTLTVDAATAAIDAYHLGHHKNTDILAISFSSHDYVGHSFGPNSDENESMVRAEDAEVSRLLNTVRKKMPGQMKDIIMVLTADHGIVPPAAWLQKNRVDAQAVDYDDLLRQINFTLDHKFGKAGKSWIAYTEDFSYWLDTDILQNKKIEKSAVDKDLKAALLASGFFSFVFSAEEYQAGQLPPGMHERRIKKTYFPGIGGDVVAIVKPFHYGADNMVNHLADYSYDETVPLVIAGSRMKRGEFPEKAEVVDIAPTLSYLLGILAPALSEGRVLSEAIKH